MPWPTAEENRAKALALLKADPSLAAKELQRRKDKKVAKAKDLPPPPLVDMSLVALRSEELRAFLDG